MRSLRAFALLAATPLGAGCSATSPAANNGSLSHISSSSDAASIPADGASSATVGDALAPPREAAGPGVDAGVDATGPDAGGDGGAEAGSSSSTISWNGGNFYLYGVNYPWL